MPVRGYFKFAPESGPAEKARVDRIEKTGRKIASIHHKEAQKIIRDLEAAIRHDIETRNNSYLGRLGLDGGVGINRPQKILQEQLDFTRRLDDRFEPVK